MADHDPPAPSPPKGRAPHRRNEAARLAVLHAADDLLVELGFAKVSIEGIAARAGVAKQTIYRWWSSKTDILLDTLVEDTDRHLPVPTRGAAVPGARRYFQGLAGFLTREPAGQVLLALIGEAQHDPGVAETLRERYLEPRRAAERALLARGVADGELPPGLDLDIALDAITGPILLRALTRRPVPRRFVDQLVDQNLAPAGHS